jgi:hypothetical protein
MSASMMDPEGRKDQTVQIQVLPAPSSSLRTVVGISSVVIRAIAIGA